MLIVTSIPSHVFPENHICFASLVWFVSKYGKAGLIILSTIGGILLVIAVTIFTRLSTVRMIDKSQRIAASRMVYYLVLGFVSLVSRVPPCLCQLSDGSQAFVIPFFVSLTIAHGDIKASMVASVVLNLSGLMSSLLHLFLRSNTAITSFEPKNRRHLNRDKHQIRIWGPNELALGSASVDPFSGPQSPTRQLGSRSDSRASLVGPEKAHFITMESLDSTSFRPPQFAHLGSPLGSNPNALEQKAIMPSIPQPAMEPPKGHARNQSYSLFPAEVTNPPKAPHQNNRPAESVYDISGLEPPPMMFGLGPSRHRRDSSMVSSATVQIGLRLSHAPTPSMEEVLTKPLPQTTYGGPPSTTSNANAGKPTPPVPLSTFNANVPRAASPLKQQTDNLTNPEPSVRSPRKPSPLNTAVKSLTLSPVLASINKLLPPTPKRLASTIRESNTQLSPTVYLQQQKEPDSLKAATTPQSATNPIRPTPLGDGSPTRTPGSNSGRAPALSQSKSDWI